LLQEKTATKITTAVGPQFKYHIKSPTCYVLVFWVNLGFGFD